MRIDLRQLRSLPISTLLLGAVNAGILVVVLLLAIGGTQSAELLATPAQPPAALDIDLAHAPLAPDLAAIQSQPLMHASRAFYAPPPPDAAPAAPPLPAYRFAGAFISPNKPAVALLSDPQGGKTRRVRQGEDLDGWNVQSIDGKHVVLAWQTQVREIGASPVTAGAGTGLRRVPIQRQRVASSAGTTISLGGGTANAGSSSTYTGAPAGDTPRLYYPPPN